jgi:hypothetical protein
MMVPGLQATTLAGEPNRGGRRIHFGQAAALPFRSTLTAGRGCAEPDCFMCSSTLLRESGNQRTNSF